MVGIEWYQKDQGSERIDVGRELVDLDRISKDQATLYQRFMFQVPFYKEHKAYEKYDFLILCLV